MMSSRTHWGDACTDVCRRSRSYPGEGSTTYMEVLVQVMGPWTWRQERRTCSKVPGAESCDYYPWLPTHQPFPNCFFLACLLSSW